MKKEWFSAKELVGISGLPTSTQGINLMARRENWECRRRKGVQGRALEYHISSLPPAVLNVLCLQEQSGEYLLQRQDPLAVWMESYYQLTVEEREKLITFILREGVSRLLDRLSLSE